MFCKKCGCDEMYLDGSCRRCSKPDVSESAELACSVAISFSEESRMLARSVLRKWWKEKKISANINQVDDEEYLAFVIEHKRLP